MSLTYSAFKQESAEGFAVSPVLPLYNVSLNVSGPQRLIRWCDTMTAAFASHKMLLPLGYAPVSSIIGLAGYDEGFEKVTFSRKPIRNDTEVIRSNSGSFSRVRSAAYMLYDLTTYGNRYHQGWIEAMRVLTGGSHVAPSTASEHAVRHSTYVGSLTPITAASSLHTGLMYLQGSYPEVKFMPDVADRFYVTSVEPLNFLQTYLTPSYSAWSFLDLLTKIRSGGFTSVLYGTSYFGACQSTLSDVGFNYSTGGVLTVTYHMHVLSPYWGDTYDWDGLLTFNLSNRPSKSNPAINTFYTPTVLVPYTIDYTNFYHEWTYRSGRENYPSYSFSDTLSCAVCLDELGLSSVDDYGQSSTQTIRTILTNAASLDDFERRVTGDFVNIAPASALSGLAAIENALGSLDNNVLQTLYKVPAIAKAVPDVLGALAILKDLAVNADEFSSYKRIIDIATRTHLQAQFTWRPYYDLLVNIGPVIAETFSDLLVTKKLSLGYGSYHHTFHNMYGRQLIHLDVRTKVVMDFSLPSVLSTFARLDAWGVLPTFARTWDLVPFSFILNWYTGIGKSLARLEKATLVWLLPAYYVHTYSLFSPFTTAELELVKASNHGVSPAGLKLFYRDVTLFSPVPRYSRHHFEIPQSTPNPAILGSLIYQLLFGGR